MEKLSCERLCIDKIFARVVEVFNEKATTLADVTLCEDFFCELYNSEEEYLHTPSAIEALESVGVFNALDLVTSYEVDQFGEMSTPPRPLRLANMMVYIYGEFLLKQSTHYAEEDLFDNNGFITEGDVERIRNEVQEYLSNLDEGTTFFDAVWDYYGVSVDRIDEIYNNRR